MLPGDPERLLPGVSKYAIVQTGGTGDCGIAGGGRLGRAGSTQETNVGCVVTEVTYVFVVAFHQAGYDCR